LAVEDGLSFNQIATSEFLSLSFISLGFKPKKSPATVSTTVNSFIMAMKQETKRDLMAAHEKGSVDWFKMFLFLLF
jgi:hypothetical protein